jgi:subtilisin family serine protease
VAADLPGQGALDVSVPKIRADRVHARFVRGDGVTVAVIDSGVESDHPDFAGALVHEECFCRGTCGTGGGIFCKPDCCPDGSARQSGPGSAAAGHPHGTNVTGILMSRGAVAGVGVAPDAKLVAIRVLDENNSGFVSDWLAALDWLAVNRPDVRVVNMSLASIRVFTSDCATQCELDCRPQDGCDPETVCGINRMLAEVVARLRRRGTIVVAASGNNSDETALSTPACVTGVFSVGATTPSDGVAFFSNGGPELDVLAPGVDVVSSGLNGGLSLLCGTVGGQRVCGGTSMAAPHVAGVAALLLSASPGMSASAIENAIVETGAPIVDFRSGRTFPRVDARAAFREVTKYLEIDPGGGAGNNDCLLAWNVLPPDIVRRSRNPVASCVDGDTICDADQISGQCTFLLSLCFNSHDPLLPFCATDEAITRIEILEPSSQAVAGSTERANADVIAASLPNVPINRADICSGLIPIVVPRNGRVGGALVRIAASTATRRDSDRFLLRCLAD